MSDFLRDYLTVVWFGAVALVLAGLLLGISARSGRTSRTREAARPTRAASTRSGIGWSQSQIRYYVFALLFVIFDVEAVFIFPWATRARALRRVRSRRDGHLRLRAAARPRVRVEARACSGGCDYMGLVDRGRLPKSLTHLFNIGRSYTLWVYQWGLACCAIEMGAAFGSPRYDVMRLGVIPLPASPRQADLVVISGTVTDKMAPAIQRLYEQMPEPKYVISMGSLRQLRRSVLGQLLGHQGRRPDHPGRHLRARLPAAPGGAARGHRAAAAADQERGHGRPVAWRGIPADRRRLLERVEATDSERRGPPSNRVRPLSSTESSARNRRRHCRRRAPRARSSTTCAAHSATRSSTSLVKPGDDLWVRVRTDAWRHGGTGASRRVGLDFFCFLSVIDWMPSPYGRGEDDPTAAAGRARHGDPPGLHRRRDPLPGASPACDEHDAALRRHHQGRRPRRQLTVQSLDPGVRRRQLARARGPRDVRHQLRRPPRPAQHVPARPDSRATRCARTSRCSPASSSRGRASSTSSRCPRPKATRRGQRRTRAPGSEPHE